MFSETVLEFLHGKDIIHRDIKPSNIILANDGHIRLIDFDAARMPKEDLEQDTRLLGTRGYVPPEQYGFAQTDARADIYSLGVTMNQLLGHKAHKLRYRRIIAKCTDLNPDKRYQSARQVKKAYSRIEWNVFCLAIGIILIAVLCYTIPLYLSVQQEDVQSDGTALTVLSAPKNPHWNGDTGIAVWGNVPQSGVEGELVYRWRLYRQDTETPPDLDKTMWDQESSMKGNGVNGIDSPTYEVNLGTDLLENGFYYFAVSAVGDGISFSDSPYVLSDAFEYTGENAPPLPAATGLEWKLLEDGLYATWNNMDDYKDKDTFSVCVYDKSGTMVCRNIWTKEDIVSIGRNGIWFSSKLFAEADNAYRFTVQAQTSRPNEFRSSLMPEPVPEEYFSPWYYPSDDKNY